MKNLICAVVLTSIVASVNASTLDQNKVDHFLSECTRIAIDNNYATDQCSEWVRKIHDADDPKSFLETLEDRFSTYGYVSYGEVRNLNVVVELEDFGSTGRDSEPLGGDDVHGFGVSRFGETILWNTSGDYAEYQVTFHNTGAYGITVDAASPMVGDLGIEISLNGTQIAESSIANTGSWNAFATQAIGTGVPIAEGTYTLRVQSAGSSAWQWNADKVVFTYQGDDEPAPEPTPTAIPSPVPTPEPNPVAEPILIEGEHFKATGGTQDGFTTRTFWGTTTFADHILTGGWADYEVYIPIGGAYDLSFIASTMEISDSNAKIYIDGVAIAESPVHGDNLNVFVEHVVAEGLNLSTGTHTVRIEAMGSVLKWHFFLDSFTFAPQ